MTLLFSWNKAYFEVINGANFFTYLGPLLYEESLYFPLKLIHRKTGIFKEMIAYEVSQEAYTFYGVQQICLHCI